LFKRQPSSSHSMALYGLTEMDYFPKSLQRKKGIRTGMSVGKKKN